MLQRLNDHILSFYLVVPEQSARTTEMDYGLKSMLPYFNRVRHVFACTSHTSVCYSHIHVLLYIVLVINHHHHRYRRLSLSLLPKTVSNPQLLSVPTHRCLLQEVIFLKVNPNW